MTELAPDGGLPTTWPVAYPRHTGSWTLKGPGGWGEYDPASGVIDIVRPADDPSLPALASVMQRGSLVGYRIGRRAIVATPDSFIKVVRPKRHAALVAVHNWLVDADLDADIPDIVAADTPGAVELSPVGGSSLHQLIRDEGPGPNLGSAIDRIAVAVADLHATPVADHLQMRAPDRPERWIETVVCAKPNMRSALAAAAERLPPLSAVPATVTHGDLHDKNIFVDDGRIGLIDLDSVAVGAPEDDVANLAVHIQLRALQGSRAVTEAGDLATRFVERSAQHRPLSPERIAAATAHTWFRLACIYMFRAGSLRLVPELLARAIAAR